MTGPGGGPVQGFCPSGDFPSSPPDGDIDLQDYAAFQRAFTGYGTGACCHQDGTCTEEIVADCVAEFGTRYHGHGSTCAGVSCPLPGLGACCDAFAGTCTEMTDVDCGFGGGFYFGDGTLCTSTACPDVRYRNVIDPLASIKTADTGLALADDMVLSGTGGGDLAYYDLALLGNGGGTFNVTVGLYDDYPGSGGVLIAGTERTISDLEDLGSPVFASATFDPSVAIPQQFWMVATFSNAQAGWFIAEQAEVGSTADFYGRYVPPWTWFWFGGNPYAGFWANVATLESGGAQTMSMSGGQGLAGDPQRSGTDVVTVTVRPLGGGEALTTLAPHTEYELHYATECAVIKTHVIFAKSERVISSITAAAPPRDGAWAKAGNFLLTLEASDPPSIPPEVPWGYHRFATMLNGFWGETEASADETGHLLNFTTGSAGALAFEVYLIGESDGAMVSMAGTLELGVAADD